MHSNEHGLTRANYRLMKKLCARLKVNVFWFFCRALYYVLRAVLMSWVLLLWSL